jgi:hypothetical protein
MPVVAKQLAKDSIVDKNTMLALFRGEWKITYPFLQYACTVINISHKLPVNHINIQHGLRIQWSMCR